MALGSLIDAGADLDEVLAVLERLPLGGWALEVEPVLRGGIAASRAVVSVQDTVVVRTHAHIVGLVEEARLPERVARRALATFAALADVEARLHRRPVDQVHFHEVGGHDTIIDVVGTAAALEVLGHRRGPGQPGGHRAWAWSGPPTACCPIRPRRWWHCSKGAPTWGRNIAVELTTPTGAALLAALCSGFGPMPADAGDRTGLRGRVPRAGRAPQLHPGGDRAQVARVDGSGPLATAAAVAVDGDADAGQPVAHLETNVDDATGEQLAHAIGGPAGLGRLRRLAGPGGHEEGAPGLGGPRAVRPVDGDITPVRAPAGHRLTRGPDDQWRTVAGGALDRVGVDRWSADQAQGQWRPGQSGARGRGLGGAAHRTALAGSVRAGRGHVEGRPGRVSPSGSAEVDRRVVGASVRHVRRLPAPTSSHRLGTRRWRWWVFR